MTIEAAGILFVAPDNKVLFLSRAAGESDAPGTWAFPGGKIEDTDEDAKDAACRECEEETGHRVKRTDITLHTRRQKDGVDFTTFLCRLEKEFVPKLNNEHDGYAWAPADKPPAPLHPGCMVALQRLMSDELGVARLMMAGELTSPQKYENVWLFDIRITGTGVAYRNALDEFAHRPPEEYLNPEFLARCNGLPVIWKHPDNATLNSEEFASRIVGTVFLPYIGDGVRHPAEDVWAIAKIHDEEAARRMTAEQLSTSPGVVLKKEDVQEKLELSNGSTLLLEGKPHLLDHVAICEVGVWDKGNAPTGVVTEGTETMTDSTARKDAAEMEEKKADAEAVTVDKLLKCLDEQRAKADALEKENAEYKKANDDNMRKADAISRRLDAMEREDGQTEGADFASKATKLDDDDDERDDRRKDSRRRKDGEDEEERSDRRKDARRKDDGEEEEKDDRRKDARRKDEDEEMEARRDRRRKDDDDDRRSDSRRRYDRRHDDDDRRADARADSVSRADYDKMMRELDALKAKLPKPLSDADWHEMHAIQSRADSVYGAFGANNRAPRPMEGETPPNYRRRLMDGLKKHSPLWKDIDLYVAINDTALPNIEQAIYNDAMQVARNPTLGEGELRMIERKLPSGHTSVEFAGRPSAWMQQFAGNRRQVAGIRTKTMN